MTKLNRIMDKAKEKGVKMHFPLDGVCAETLTNFSPTSIHENDDIPEGWQIYDIGPVSLAKFQLAISRSDLIFWNGPVGVFELENFQTGSL